MFTVFDVCTVYMFLMFVGRMFSLFFKSKTVGMSVEELIRAVRSNQPAEVVRLLDDEHVDVNCGDEVSLVYLL